ncbi:MAG: aminoacetone oxidase family FAD-binding enzyme [Bacteroidales bacterium]|nr:aminoacetone oxidase family FAD-binding enzyme [Bacteroidales bacterium]
MYQQQVAVVGGGAAGHFLAIRLKELCPRVRVVIVERARRVLAKVKVSGGGRCNVTNTFAAVQDLGQVYPRGAKLLKRTFRAFDHEAAWEWFEGQGVPLVAQEDECVFPRSQQSDSIIMALTRRAQQLGVETVTGVSVEAVEREGEAFVLRCGLGQVARERWTAVAVTTGGAPKGEGHAWLAALGHKMEAPCPSLFTFEVQDAALTALMGIVVEGAQLAIAGTKWRSEGALLLTHWGMSGPATLKLSAHAARYLHEHDYRAPLLVSWLGTPQTEVALQELLRLQGEAGHRLLGNVRPEGLQTRLWHYLLQRSGLMPERPWSEVGRKGLNRLANTLTADAYEISGRGAWKEEFVTCGGVALSSVDAARMESRVCRGLFFAGEVLDIDGVTGGFNFTAAWSTAWVAAEGLAQHLVALHGEGESAEGFSLHEKG